MKVQALVLLLVAGKPRKDLLIPGVTGRQLNPRALGLSRLQVRGPSPCTSARPLLTPQSSSISSGGRGQAVELNSWVQGVSTHGEMNPLLLSAGVRSGPGFAGVTLCWCWALQWSGRWGVQTLADACNN